MNTLKEYVASLKEEDLLKETYDLEELLNTKIEHITYNSKESKENTLFICKGFSFKEEYLKEAIDKGSILYVSEKKYLDFPCIIVKDIKKAQAILAKTFYHSPEDFLNLIGITGTKGKSTIASFTKNILDNEFSDTALISTIETYDGIEKYESLMTTPESLEIRRHLYNAKVSKIKNVVMEVSSQALKYDRTYKLHFKIGVFCNISNDHISLREHPNFDDYFQSKLKLLEMSENVVLNKDMDFFEEVLAYTKNAKQIITYSMKDANADFYAHDIKKVGEEYYSFQVTHNNTINTYHIRMAGIFNIENALASIAIANLLNVKVSSIKKALEETKVKGRMEVYKSDTNKTIAIVDYAHNKISFESLLKSVKEEYPDKKIITVFGCPGQKAENRRKEMGEIANLYADFSYLTTDDPAKEDPLDICKQIAFFINQSHYKIVLDREDAIKEAILDHPGEVIVIAGKGCETHQKCETLEDYIGDKECVMKAFKEEQELILV